MKRSMMKTSESTEESQELIDKVDKLGVIDIRGCTSTKNYRTILNSIGESLETLEVKKFLEG